MEKERIVDQFILHIFGDLLPGYKMFHNGNQNIDKYINFDTIKNLPEAITKYITDYPR